jgi:hypothetical protein
LQATDATVVDFCDFGKIVVFQTLRCNVVVFLELTPFFFLFCATENNHLRVDSSVLCFALLWQLVVCPRIRSAGF